MACAGHACWQAVCISDSVMGRSCTRESMRARSMRWTQYVHFSMTPRLRTVTSGFMRSFSTSEVSYV